MPYNRKLFTLPLCAALLLSLLTACGEKKDASSSQASSAPKPASSGSAAASSSASKAASSSATAASSGSTASSAATTADATKTINATVQTSDGQTAVLVLQIPSNWEFDGYSTFMRDDIKIAEVATVWKITDTTNPFSEEMVGYFAHPELADGPQYPEGFGLVEMTDRNLDGALTRTYLYRTTPDDATKEWFPHYIFRVIGDYVLQIHCYSFDKTADDATFDAILSSAKLSLS